jgi:hypothetical protein
MEPTIKISDFIAQHNITMTSKRITDEAHLERRENTFDNRRTPGGLRKHSGMSHWSCTLRMGKRKLTVDYSMGAAHKGEPEIDSVLDSLKLDASDIIDGVRFQEWAENLGYDTDSRRAESIFKACVKGANKLRQFFADSPDALEELLRNVESL